MILQEAFETEIVLRFFTQQHAECLSNDPKIASARPVPTISLEIPERLNFQDSVAIYV